MVKQSGLIYLVWLIFFSPFLFLEQPFSAVVVVVVASVVSAHATLYFCTLIPFCY
jgi:hypothetical protein